MTSHLGYYSEGVSEQYQQCDNNWDITMTINEAKEMVKWRKKTIIKNSCQILSPSETGFIVSAHRLLNITLLTPTTTL